jgi:hypothetical protein
LRIVAILPPGGAQADVRSGRHDLEPAEDRIALANELVDAALELGQVVGVALDNGAVLPQHLHRTVAGALAALLETASKPGALVDDRRRATGSG